MPMATPEEQRQYQREWIARRRAAFFADKKCVRCGSTDKLELDHKDPVTKSEHLKRAHTGSFWSWSQKRRDEEIAKCQVLCHPCHVQKTNENGDHVRGEQVGTAKYTEGIVRYVRAQRAAGVRLCDLAAELNMPKQTIWGMCNRRWKHVI